MNSVDIIIPVYKPDERLELLLAMLYTQTMKPDRVILLWTIPEGEEFDEERYSSLPMQDQLKVVKIPQKEFDHGGTRRLGVTYSSAEYFVMMTQDAVPAGDNLIENLINSFYNDEVAAVYARQLASDDAKVIERITRTYNYPGNPRIQNKHSLIKYGIKTYFCSDVCAAYKREAYDKTGGFIERAIFNEDMIMAHSLIELGYTVFYSPPAQVIHSHNYNYRTQYKRNFDIAVSQADHPEVFENVSSESEGMTYVKTVIKQLIEIHKIYLIPDFIIQSAFKYLGFRKGKKYKKLSNKTILKHTLNKQYWERTT